MYHVCKQQSRSATLQSACLGHAGQVGDKIVQFVKKVHIMKHPSRANGKPRDTGSTRTAIDASTEAPATTSLCDTRRHTAVIGPARRDPWVPSTGALLCSVGQQQGCRPICRMLATKPSGQSYIENKRETRKQSKRTAENGGRGRPRSSER